MRFNKTGTLLAIITAARLTWGSPIDTYKRQHVCTFPYLPFPPICPEGQHIENGNSCYFCCRDS
ncbi:small cysteine-rich protein [Agaricus bisporus var. bisporus H97]|uniref:small cysteine-rich protein n=1 Tax=Agaricus bisporus var. bisporus (strain H97 / ATCC MYA-4626 / FGSC 10389) TaxID=936046 RepID=UPI00029F564B|nr:small cysteine-rich protein [Agaricus bisporus var. bisporus H97]EKV49646.1 small cysteine-rich protein [Agaricus bisporus var. bisporus H97]